jgi:hypothetical protein
MEPHKRAKYSKSLDPDEIEEVLMDEESDEELEDEVVEPCVQSSSSSEDEDDAEEIEVVFIEFYRTSKWRQPVSCLRYKCRIFSLFNFHSLFQAGLSDYSNRNKPLLPSIHVI